MSTPRDTNVSIGRRLDIALAVIFAGLTFVFILSLVFHQPFFDFAWARHQNLLSWYIRPLLSLPFCYFAYRRSFGGMFFSIFAIATSMMWFPEPSVPSEAAKEFLRMEVEYVSGGWTPLKLLAACLVPLFFVSLGTAFWRRKPMYGFLVLLVFGIAKMVWSVAEGSTSGYAVFPAAILGIVVLGTAIAVSSKKRWL